MPAHPHPLGRPFESMQLSGRSGLQVPIGAALAGPAFAYALLLLAVPLSALAVLSFWTQDYLQLDRTFTFENFRVAWTEPVYRVLMLRSLWVSALVTAITILIALPMACFVSFHVKPERKPLWVFLVTVPFWTSYLLRIFSWKVILGYNGVVNGTLTGLGIIQEPLTFILYNLSAVIVTLSHAWVPLAFLPIFISLERVDRALLDAAADLGENAASRFLRVTLPLAMPGIVGAALIVFVPTVGDYVTPKLVGGPEGLLIANMIELQFKSANNAPLGAALAASAMLVVGAIAVLFLRLCSRHLGTAQP